MPFCQQWLRLLQLWRLSAECNATNVALAAFGYKVQRHQPAWTRVRCARSSRCSTELPTDFQLPYCSTAVLPHTNRFHEEEHKNYKIDSTDDKKKDQKNPVEKRFSRKGPFSTGGIRLCKKWPYYRFPHSLVPLFVAISLVCWLAFFSARVFIAIHGMAKSPCCVGIVYLSCSFRPRVELSLYEASARTLVVLEVDGWKYQIKRTHTVPGILKLRTTQYLPVSEYLHYLEYFKND